MLGPLRLGFLGCPGSSSPDSRLAQREVFAWKRVIGVFFSMPGSSFFECVGVGLKIGQGCMLAHATATEGRLLALRHISINLPHISLP